MARCGRRRRRRRPALVVGPDGFPAGTPLHPATPGTKDAALTQAANADGSCAVPPRAADPAGRHGVRRLRRQHDPAALPAIRPRHGGRPPPAAADRTDHRRPAVSDAGVDWAWYSGGWSNADGDVGAPGWTNGTTPGTCTDPNTVSGAVYPNCPDKLFQFHHQPFNYYANYAPGTAARAAHLRDEAGVHRRPAKAGTLKPVSFVKPIGAENEHPGYASEHAGSEPLVDLLKAIEHGPDAADTLVIVTYDEFGGQWDHVAPPHGVAASPTSGVRGPGSRRCSSRRCCKHPFSRRPTEHDTTSILATIEHRFRLPPLTTRDAAVADLFRAPVFPGNRP